VSGPVLVAGAAGFVGANVVRALLDEGIEAQALVRPGTGDDPPVAALRDPEATARAVYSLRPRAVLNSVRARHGSGVSEQVDGHVLPATNLLDAAIAIGCERFVQLGSSLEYGPGPSPIDEEAAVAPVVPFGLAKAAATEVALAAGNLGKTATTVLRPFMVYGPLDREERLIPAAARAGLERRPLPMTEPGLRRDWVFVEDLARACISALDGGADGEIVNLGSGVATSNEDLVALVAEAVGRPIDARFGELPPRPWDVPRRWAATGKARELLGWTASTPLDEGIRRTVEWVGATIDREAALR
jgi:nucleoside-diphosphate-sugar epimerase